jgi:hypothetical protein
MAEALATPRILTPAPRHHNRLTSLGGFFEHLRRSIDRNSGVIGGVAVLSVSPDPLTFADSSDWWQRRQEICWVAVGRIVGCLHYSDLVTRVSTDQFLVLSEGVGGVEGAAQLAERLRTTVRWPERSSDEERWVTASIGIAFAEEVVTPDGLTDHATTAMQSARVSGGDRYQFYGPWLAACQAPEHTDH